MLMKYFYRYSFVKKTGTYNNLKNGRDNLPACKPSNHFHIEYHPCPNNESRKIDIVNYGHAAKVTHTKGVNFLSDEMVKINTKDNVSWIVVNHTHQLTRELGKVLSKI